MTVASTVNSNPPVTGDGATSVFPYSYRVFLSSHVRVIVADLAGAETVLTETTDYTVDGVGQTSGGNITLAGTTQAWVNSGGFLRTGWTIFSRRVVPLLQNTLIRNQTTYFASVHEDTFDTLLFQIQQLDADLDHAIKLPETETPTAAASTFPSAAARANRALLWDGAGDIIAGAVVVTPPSSENIAQCRFNRLNGTTAQLVSHQGNRLDVNGELLTVAAAGQNIVVTDFLIDALGISTGAGMLASTLYFIYASNTSASAFPSSVRGSTTAPSLFNGVKYLGATGNEANWRFVGWMFPNAGITLPFGGVDLPVKSEYNRRNRRLMASPAFVNDNARATYTTTSTTWTRANGGTGSRISAIFDGIESAKVRAFGLAEATAATEAHLGISRNGSITDVLNSAVTESTTPESVSCEVRDLVPTEGNQTFDLMIRAGSAAVATFVADDIRAGAVDDPIMTALIMDIDE